ncbi:hypothetical protein GGS24DRAFT_513528 [Hypoxylon argillaceum]|nr:hypothetical protein GGS24DRAFT_513528 [Hypoxylon argillaceum]
MRVVEKIGSRVLGILSRVFGRPTGWKQAATVNCILLCIISIILIGLLITTAIQAGGIEDPVLFYEGSCKQKSASYLNFFLHLLINIVSTLVVSRKVKFIFITSPMCLPDLLNFASSNFFMQILNAPTRDEIDAAHQQGTWLEIGVSSARNVFRVSKFKTCCWIGLLVTSIPIHLLFNSTVFETEYRGSNYHLTIATEEFLNGGPFFPPGASLLTADASDHIFWTDFGYGTMGSVRNYTNKESATMRRLSSTATLGRTWDRIEASDCFEQYASNCNGLDRYGDVILVVDKPGGWTRNDMWQLLKLGYDALGYNDLFWDHLVPANAPNHLFYDTTCAMSEGVANYNVIYPGWSGSCLTDCAVALGWGSTNYDGNSPYPFFGDRKPSGNKILPILRPGSDTISVQYCLADQLESSCYVGVSKILLFAISLSIIIKTGIALLVTIVLSRRDQISLVTIGDSIASFLEKPDVVTVGSAGSSLYKSLIHVGPKRWQALNKWRSTVVPVYIWIASYLLFAISISICIYLLASPVVGDGSLRKALTGSFFASSTNPFITRNFTLLTGILTANSPQILLSASYLAYNNLFTRLQMTQEWAMYKTDYYPLRVTDPQGMQKSTYRLQLPYKYSVPLIVLSIFLHFLISNTIYVVVSFGGYLKIITDGLQPGLPDDSAVRVGFSPISLLVVPTIATFLVTIPIILGFKKLPRDMVIVGSNSLAISAACHASSLSQATLDIQTPSRHSNGNDISTAANKDNSIEITRRQSDEYTEMESTSMLRHHDQESIVGGNADSSDDIDVLGRIARSKIRWGVVQMPPDWYQAFTQDDETGHLSFGVEKDGVSPPEHGRWYA